MARKTLEDIPLHENWERLQQSPLGNGEEKSVSVPAISFSTRLQAGQGRMVEGNAKSLCLPLSLAIRDWDVPQHDEQGDTSMLTMDGEPIEDEDGLGSNKNKSKSLSRLSSKALRCLACSAQFQKKIEALRGSSSGRLRI